MNMKKNNKGFTLIELLVVIAIIGLLSTLAVVALNSARMKSRDARRLSDVKQIQTALELFYNDQGQYPSITSNAGYLGTVNGVCLDETGFNATCTGNNIYMATVPAYPSPTTDGTCPGSADEDTGYYYTFNASTDASTYILEYCLGGTAGGMTAGEKEACEAGINGCDVISH